MSLVRSRQRILKFRVLQTNKFAIKGLIGARQVTELNISNLTTPESRGYMNGIAKKLFVEFLVIMRVFKIFKVNNQDLCYVLNKIKRNIFLVSHNFFKVYLASHKKLLSLPGLWIYWNNYIKLFLSFTKWVALINYCIMKLLQPLWNNRPPSWNARNEIKVLLHIPCLTFGPGSFIEHLVRFVERSRL